MRFRAFLWLCPILFSTRIGSALASPVSQDRATALATGWLREGTARLGKKLSPQMQATVPYRDASDEIAFYAIQLAPQGLIIIAANDLVEPVIAFSDSGTTNDLVDGSPLWAMLGSDLPQRSEEARMIEAGYAAPATLSKSGSTPTSQLELAQANKAKWEKYANSEKPAANKATSTSSASQTTPTTGDADSPSYGGLPSVSDMRIAPIILSKWNQKTAQGLACYNYYCPPGPDGNVNNYYAGCIATCMAQLMRYLQTPAAANGHSYVYSDMPLNPQQGTLTLVNRMAIGQLLVDCGTAANMQYSAGGSSASFLDARNALVSVFGYSNAKYIYTAAGLNHLIRDSILLSNLAAGYPVLTGIRQTSNNDGHAVITDGFGYSSATMYFHVNYGWGVSSDAWYNMPNMNSSPSYNIVDLLVYNIYTTGAGEIIAGRIVDSNGEALQGVTLTATTGSANYSATTDAGGYYGICVPGGYTYTMTAVKPGYTSEPLTGVVVGTSSTYYTPNVNYWGADITLTSDSAQAIPTLGEWEAMILAASLLIFGAHSIWNQRVMHNTQAARPVRGK